MYDGGETLIRKKDARKNPHWHHYEVDQSADTLNLLRATGSEQAQATESNCTDRSEQENGEYGSKHTHVEDQHTKPEQQCHFYDHQHQAAAGKGHQKIAAPHRGSHETLEQLALAHVHQGESDSPHSRVHQVHSQQSGNEEIDITRARLGGSNGRGGHGILTARGCLQGVVDFRSRKNTFGTRGVVVITETTVGVGLYYKIVFAEAEALECK